MPPAFSRTGKRTLTPVVGLGVMTAINVVTAAILLLINKSNLTVYGYFSSFAGYGGHPRLPRRLARCSRLPVQAGQIAADPCRGRPHRSSRRWAMFSTRAWCPFKPRHTTG